MGVFAYLFDIKTIFRLLNINDRNWSKIQIYLKTKSMSNVLGSQLHAYNILWVVTVVTLSHAIHPAADEICEERAVRKIIVDTLFSTLTRRGRQ